MLANADAEQCQERTKTQDPGTASPSLACNEYGLYTFGQPASVAKPDANEDASLALHYGSVPISNANSGIGK